MSLLSDKLGATGYARQRGGSTAHGHARYLPEDVVPGIEYQTEYTLAGN